MEMSAQVIHACMEVTVETYAAVTSVTVLHLSRATDVKEVSSVQILKLCLVHF